MTERMHLVALNADVVSYSRHLADDREGTTEKMQMFRAIIERQVEKADGFIIDLAGDNFMAAFGEATNAMRAAIAITREIEDSNALSEQDRPLLYRMGLDMGEVLVDDGHYFGDALNIAARIQAIAPAGGISVSGRVFTALDEPALRFRRTGSQRLKNIPEEVEVYRLLGFPHETGADYGSSLALDSPSIAVLPVHADTVEGSYTGLIDAFRTELLHQLAAIPQLSVIRPTVGDSGAPSVAARYMLESGAHQIRDQIRLYANVVDVTTMNIVKSNRWIGSVDDLFEEFEELGARVARDVEVELIVGAPGHLYSDLDDPRAIQDIYMGWYHLTAGTPEDWARSVELFTRVLERHPSQPFGYVLTGFSHWMGAIYDWSPDYGFSIQEARRLSHLGAEVGDPTGMAKMVEAASLMSEGKGDEALRAVEEAEIVRPTCDATYGIEGSIRRYLGEYDRAVGLEDTAMRLTGMNKPWYPTVKACSLLMAGNDEQAAALAEAVVEHHPNNLEALLVLAAAQNRLGLTRRAGATAQMVKDTFPGVDVNRWIDGNPYQDQEQVDRWKSDLRDVGVLQ